MKESKRERVWRVFLGAALTLFFTFFLLGPPVAFAKSGAGEFSGRAAIAIFAATYLVIAIGKLPGFYLDRAGTALLGASLMVGAGVLPLEDAFRAIDFATLALLLGMMIVVGNLRLSGFFRLVNNELASRMRHPLALLAAITLSAGFFSAFLVNDAICLVMTPLVLDLARRLGRNPVPYLLAVAAASNIGGVATITGNPQNIMIGSFSHIPYDTFAFRLAPVAAVGLLVAFILIALLYRREFLTRERLNSAAAPAHAHGPLALKSALVVLAMVVAFFLHQPPAKVALIAGSFMLLTRAVKSHKVYREIDWPLLLMFAGLFVVVAGFEKAIDPAAILARWGPGKLAEAPLLAFLTAGLSNLVSNVPAVMMLKPFVQRLPDTQHAWLLVAMASTLSGNLTILGSVANLIVVQWAGLGRVRIGFWEHLRLGAPLALLTILFGLWWL